MAELGHREQQLVGLEEVVTGATGTSLFSVEMLLDDYLHIGRTDRALDKLSEELAKVERTGDHLGESELHRLRGEVVLAGDPAKRRPRFAGPSKLRETVGEVVGAARHHRPRAPPRESGKAR